jgi:hypothetical protein
VAGGAIGKGIAAIGGDIGDVGDALFKIEEERQRQEEAAALASGASDLNKLLGKELENVQLEVLQNRNQATERMKNISDAYDAEVARLTADMPRRAALRFTNSTKAAKEGELAKIRNTLRLKQLDFNKNDTLRQYSNNFEVLAGQGLAVNDILNHPDVKLTDANMKPYWKPGEQERQKNILLANVLINPKIGRYDDATKLIQQTTGLLSTEKNAKLRNIESAKKAASASAKVLKDDAIEAELAEIDKMFILPQDEFLALVPETLDKINSSIILPVKGKNGAGKEGQRKKILDRVKAINEGKLDPVYEFDSDYYDNLSKRISNNPRSVSESEINLAAGRGKNRGITAGKDGQQGKLLSLKRFLQDDEAQGELYKTYSEKLTALKAAKIFHQNRKRNDVLASEARILLNNWAQGDIRTIQDYETFFDGLLESIGASNLEPATGFWFSFESGEQRIVSAQMRDFAISQGVDLTEETVAVKHPDGREGTIPASQLEEALEEGYTEIK